MGGGYLLYHAAVDEFGKVTYTGAMKADDPEAFTEAEAVHDRLSDAIRQASKRETTGAARARAAAGADGPGHGAVLGRQRQPLLLSLRASLQGIRRGNYAGSSPCDPPAKGCRGGSYA